MRIRARFGARAAYVLGKILDVRRYASGFSCGRARSRIQIERESIGALGRAALTCGLVALPNVALACPSCLASTGEATRLAFLGTMVLMTSLPVLMIGGLIFWIARRSSAPDLHADADVEPRDARPPREAPRLVE